MRRSFVACLAVALAFVGFPVRSETFRSSGPPFSIEYPDGWKILPAEGGLLTRAVGPGSAMNVSVAAASRPDFDADRFSDAELDRIAQELADATAGALEGFELLERGKAKLGGKPAAFFRYRAVVQSPKGSVETIGIYYATAHRGLVYSVTGVTRARLARRTQPEIIGAIQSFRFPETSAPGGAESP
jgi:hypothetical protein